MADTWSAWQRANRKDQIRSGVRKAVSDSGPISGGEGARLNPNSIDGFWSMEPGTRNGKSMPFNHSEQTGG
jgi:hypothetical protein